jgi:AmiR/NasT family two-component response regulator
MDSTKPPLRALICEDECLTVMQLRQALMLAGYEVVGEAMDGESGCDLARSLEPDFVLMDVNLQGMNGIESTRRIMDERPSPIIMLTAYGDEKTVEAALDAGACYYLVKPVVGEQLIPAIKTAIARFDAMEGIRKENDSLKDQLETRKLVERAKGIIMERMRLGEAEAFRRMQKTSRDKCQTLKRTAQDIISADTVLS